MKVYFPHWTDVSAGAAAFCGPERRVAIVGGGIAGLAAAQLTYWKLQAQDWWRERGAA